MTGSAHGDADQRALRPTGAGIAETPNGNDPATHPPATVGPPTARPGDPHGVEVVDEATGPPRGPTRFTASPWSGWPAEWSTPLFNQFEGLVDTAWNCLDLNASVLSTMPPYIHRGELAAAGERG